MNISKDILLLRFRFIIALLQFTCGFLISVHGAKAATQQPKWFPKVACDKLGFGENPFQYDFNRDAQYTQGNGNRGYSGYVQRTEAQTRGRKRTDCYKTWTVLVYMAADNDLSPYAIADLDEMEGPFSSGQFAASTGHTDLLVEADLANSSGIRRYHMFQKPGTKYRTPAEQNQVRNFAIDQIQSPLVEFQKEPRLGPSQNHPQRFADFLRWGMRRYPARHYFVIIWGHGQGWTIDSSRSRRPTHETFGGFGFDEQKGDRLGIPRLGEILRRVVRDTLENKKQIDLLATDACLMQTLEVTYELSDSTRFIIGSPQVKSFFGLPYRRLLYEMNSRRFLTGVRHQSDDEAFHLAKALPTIAAKSFEPRSGSQRADKEAHKTFAMSALSTVELRNQLMPALQRLSHWILRYFAEDPVRTFDLQVLLRETQSFLGNTRDLGSFLEIFERHLRETMVTASNRSSRTIPNLLEAIRETQQALKITAVAFAFGSAYQPSIRQSARQSAAMSFRALAFWLPLSALELRERIKTFRTSQFHQYFSQVQSNTNSWELWITSIYGET